MNNDWVEKFDDYLNGRMTPEEQSLFESEMETNKELLSAFNLYRTIETEMRYEQMDMEEEAALIANLKKLNKVYSNTEATEHTSLEKESETPVIELSQDKALDKQAGKIVKINFWKTVAIAAGIVGIALMGIF